MEQLNSQSIKDHQEKLEIHRDRGSYQRMMVEEAQGWLASVERTVSGLSAEHNWIIKRKRVNRRLGLLIACCEEPHEHGKCGEGKM